MAFRGLMEIFLKVCEKFNEVDVEYVIGGGFAVILHGLPRLTNDIDFFVNPSKENVEKIKTALIEIFNDESINDIKPTDIEEYSVVRYVTPEGFYLDFIGKVGEMFRFSDIKKRIEWIEIENIKVPVCNVETLLELKEKSLRPIDQQDVIFLKEKLKRKRK